MSVSNTFASFAKDISKDAAKLPNLKQRRTSGIELHSNVPEARGHRVSSANTESHIVQQHTSNSITKIQQNRRKESSDLEYYLRDILNTISRN